jgi:GNAT superfamily N-acetyltransferase
MRVKLDEATKGDAAAVAAIRNAAADQLTAQFGKGHWSSLVSEKLVLFQMKYGTAFIVRKGKQPIATLTLSKKKPWAHDRSYFTASRNPRFLIGMAVHPDLQRAGVGAGCINALKKIASASNCDAICLDAYDHAAGAGEFYRKCGFKEAGRVVYRGTPLVYFEMLLASPKAAP